MKCPCGYFWREWRWAKINEVLEIKIACGIFGDMGILRAAWNKKEWGKDTVSPKNYPKASQASQKNPSQEHSRVQRQKLLSFFAYYSVTQLPTISSNYFSLFILKKREDLFYSSFISIVVCSEIA